MKRCRNRESRERERDGGEWRYDMPNLITAHIYSGVKLYIQ